MNARALLSRLVDVATAFLLIVAVALLARPGSSLRLWIEEWRSTRADAHAVRSEWSALQRDAMPLYEGSDRPSVILFTDYQCPFCRAADAVVDSAVRSGVRLAIVHLPLTSIHPLAEPAAIATLCSAQQGAGRTLFAALMSASDWQADTAWSRHAHAAGVRDTSAFAACRKGAPAAKQLQALLGYAQRLHVNSTPTFIGQSSQRIAGVPSLAALQSLAAQR